MAGSIALLAAYPTERCSKQNVEATGTLQLGAEARRAQR